MNIPESSEYKEILLGISKLLINKDDITLNILEEIDTLGKGDLTDIVSDILRETNLGNRDRFDKLVKILNNG